MEMLQARRRFLESGAYTPLSTAVSQLAQTCLTRDIQTITILDVGCGEGYYVNQVHQAFEKARPETAVCTFGSDIAKTAVKLAAKRHPTTQFLVADTNRFIPCADRSLQLLLNIFAPRHPAEFARILVSGGYLLIVIPGTTHLQQLRTQFSLLDIEPEKQPRLLAQLADNFTQKSEAHIEFPLRLYGQQIHDLVYMMPAARHLSMPQQQALQATSSYTTTAQFHLLLFQKHDT